MDHSWEHSSYQAIAKTKLHFSWYHHQTTKILARQIHQNPSHLLDCCQTSSFMKMRKFMPSLFTLYYYQMKKTSLIKPDLNFLINFINFLSSHQKMILLIVTISHLHLKYFIKFITAVFIQLPMQTRLQSQFKALAKLLAEELLLVELII